MKPTKNQTTVTRPSGQIPEQRLVRPLPCPFCGKLPEVFPSGDRTDGAEMVECMTDGCLNPHVSYYGVNVARKKWNMRIGVETAIDREQSRYQPSTNCWIALERLKEIFQPNSLSPDDGAGQAIE